MLPASVYEVGRTALITFLLFKTKTAINLRGHRGQGFENTDFKASDYRSLEV